MKKLIFSLAFLLECICLFAYTADELNQKALEYYGSKKYKQAIEYWTMAKDAGYADAYAFLAMCYEYGNGVKKNMNMCKNLLEQGVEAGSVLSMNDLGSFYLNGDGGVVDQANAVRYFSMASQKGNETAQSNLALCYKNGWGVEKNLELAALWYRVAAINDHDSALEKYIKLADQGYEISKEQALAFINNNYQLADEPESLIHTQQSTYSHINESQEIQHITQTQSLPIIQQEQKETYFYLHLPGSPGDRMYLSLNGEEVKLSNMDTKIAIEPDDELRIVLGSRFKNGKENKEFHFEVVNSVKAGETLYYAFISFPPSFRPMKVDEIIKIKNNIPEMKSLIKKQPDNIMATNQVPPQNQVLPSNPQPSTLTAPGPIIKADVDTYIPVNSSITENSFAVVIANENYLNVSKVEYALNDGDVFSKYCNKTLGIPENHILFCKDATYGIMESVISRIETIGNAYDGAINIIFYYAGHGIPDEKTRDAFLIPIDGDGSSLSTCFRTSSIYKRLSNIHAQSVIVFMDACFSGSVRGDGMLASARGVRISANDDHLEGNMVVLTAAHGDETAYPYKEKGHGLFTYFLLKKMQDSSGNTSLGDLSDYVISSVKKESVVNCGRIQTPTTISSNAAINWREWKLR